MHPLSTSYTELLRNLKKKPDRPSNLNVAVLADFASQHLVKGLQAAAIAQNLELSVWEADYDSIEMTIYNSSSELYQGHFDFILIFYSSLKLYKEYSKESLKQGFAAKKTHTVHNLVSLLQERTKSRVIISNFAEFDDAIFGNYANKTDRSFLYQIRKLNLALMDMAISQKNLFIVDAENLMSTKGRFNSFDPKLYIHADLIYDLDFVAQLATSCIKIIAALQGSFKKCVILDLDNTLWGGIIGDDGIENLQLGELGLGKAFTNFQIWLRNLKERGIILAVSSKNTEEIAKEVFLKHPGMVLKLEDISVFAANWETKVDNILFIQSVLNIGFDSIVFIDDNPFERTIVKQHIPFITVPDLPEDPAEYLPYLQSLQLFETGSFSDEDANRTRQYQEEAERLSLQKKFLSEAEFLESLQMEATIKMVDSFSCPRVAQLTQRSNQFNLRTVRYTEQDITSLMKDPSVFTLTVSMKDTFGDYGLISCVILKYKNQKTAFIDTWIMSCRVLKRGVENLLLNELVKRLNERGFEFIEAEYIPTAKNALVKDHYSLLGFTQVQNNYWSLNIRSYTPKVTLIKNTNAYAVN